MKNEIQYSSLYILKLQLKFMFNLTNCWHSFTKQTEEIIVSSNLKADVRAYYGSYFLAHVLFKNVWCQICFQETCMMLVFSFCISN